MNEKMEIPDSALEAGKKMHSLMTRLFPICRSITGQGVRDTLKIIQNEIPINIESVPSGTKVSDWEIPNEWNINDAYIEDEQGNKIVDFKKCNLHVLGYSQPIDKTVSLSELKENIHTLEDNPKAIPFRTSYYNDNWGFCMSYNQFKNLNDCKYRVFIDSSLEPGVLNYGEIFIEGSSKEEIILSTNICHPSMANNELSGPVMLIALAKWLIKQESKRYSYRILFLPETIGAISYIAKHKNELRKNVIGGYQVVCVGGPKEFVYVKSRNESSIINKITDHILKYSNVEYKIEDFRWRGSDERQWNSPGIELDVGMLAKSKFEQYPEYHTSLDDLDYVKPIFLAESFEIYTRCLRAIEENNTYNLMTDGEPRLSKYNLWSSIGGTTPVIDNLTQLVLALIGYTNGKNDLLDIAKIHRTPIWEYYELVELLKKEKLLSTEK